VKVKFAAAGGGAQEAHAKCSLWINKESTCRRRCSSPPQRQKMQINSPPAAQAARVPPVMCERILEFIKTRFVLCQGAVMPF
jgi:hypothetical protein